MRITIVGLPGSGKTMLAKRISEKVHIPHIHIDRFWLEAGGGHNSRTTPSPELTHAQVREKVLEAIQGESWVSDGLYPGIQPEIAERADTIVFLDIALWRRLLNHARRVLRGDEHREITFFVEMIGWGSTKASKIRNLIKPYESKVVVLKSRKEIEKYLQSLDLPAHDII